MSGVCTALHVRLKWNDYGERTTGGRNGDVPALSSVRSGGPLMTERDAILMSAICGALLIAVMLVGLLCLVGVCPTWG